MSTTWTGTTNNDWDTPSNWSTGAVPTSSVTVNFTNTGSNRNITGLLQKRARRIIYTSPGAEYIISGNQIFQNDFIRNQSNFTQIFEANISTSTGFDIETITSNIIINNVTRSQATTVPLVNKFFGNKLTCNASYYSNNFRIHLGILEFTKSTIIDGSVLINNNARLEISNPLFLNNVTGNSLVFGNGNIVATTCKINLNDNIYNYIESPDTIIVQQTNLILGISNLLTTGTTRSLFKSPITTYNLNSLTIDSSLPQYSGLTFSVNGNLWTSNVSATGNSFIFNSNIGNLYVFPYPSSVSLTSSLNPALSGDNILFSALVSFSNNFGTISGNVTFKDNGNDISTINLINGYANLNINTLSGGFHSITAIYNGNDYYLPSISNAINQEIISTSKTISNIADWTSYVGDNTARDYILSNDIYFNSFFPGNLFIKNNSIFDGKNNSIYLKNINNFSGLFNLNGIIKNMKVFIKNVTLNDFNGFLAEGSGDNSKIYSGTIENVFIILKDTIMGNNCGGLIGSCGNNVTIKLSYVNGVINGFNSGGLVGNNCSNINIYNSYVIGKTNNNVGCLIGNNNLIDTVKNTYHAGISTNNLILSGSIINKRTNLYRANIRVL
jgi:hypothetical protein